MYGAIAGIVGGVGLGLSADRVIGIAGCRKLLLLGCCALGGVGFSLFALATTAGGLFETATDGARLIWVYVASVFGSLWCVTTTPRPSSQPARRLSAQSLSLSLPNPSRSPRRASYGRCNAATPLYYELAVEATYPVAEGLTTAAITLVQNLFCFLFLLVPQTLPALGTQWMNWAVVGACAVGLLAVLPLNEPRRRLAIDTSGGLPADAFAPAVMPCAAHTVQTGEAHQALAVAAAATDAPLGASGA